MKASNSKQALIDALQRHGFWEGRMITLSKTSYARRHRDHLLVFNAQIFTKRESVLKQVDLDLTLDAENLTAAARLAGQNFYVLYESSPTPFWKPGATTVSRALRDAVWWTRIFPEDQDLFLPLNYRPPRRQGIPPSCTIERWQNHPAYRLELRSDDNWGGMNMSAAAEILGCPPNGLRRTAEGRAFTFPISETRGQHVRAVFFHRVGPLEYIWFSNGLAFPAILYDWSISFLGSVDHTCHRDSKAIHVWQAGRVVGLLWPCHIYAPEVLANARKHLRGTFRNNTK
ncbi:MAG: hypothetical protein ACLQU4_07955 [Limisphaerales bacterium]